jgi:hypothetical protein
MSPATASGFALVLTTNAIGLRWARGHGTKICGSRSSTRLRSRRCRTTPTTAGVRESPTFTMNRWPTARRPGHRRGFAGAVTVA